MKTKILAVLLAFLFVSAISATNENPSTLENEKLIQQTEGDKPATYPGGQAELDKFIKEHLRYPKEARRYGKVIVEFTVKKSGKCENFTVVKSVIDELDYSAVETLQGMPFWEPAVKNGKKVTSVVKVPVIFKPTEDPHRKQEPEESEEPESQKG